MTEEHKPQFFAASLIVFKKGNEILLARRFNTIWCSGYYGLPSGHIEEREDATECSIREIKEEINVDIKKEDLIFTHLSQRHGFQPDGSKRTYFDIYFVCEKWSGNIVINEPNKCDELKWVNIRNLPENVVPGVKKALEYINKGIIFSEVHDEK